jgi:hypothetical protein
MYFELMLPIVDDEIELVNILDEEAAAPYMVWGL